MKLRTETVGLAPSGRQKRKVIWKKWSLKLKRFLAGLMLFHALIPSFSVYGNGNLIETIDPLGYREISIFNEMGNVVTTINAMGHIQQFEYDPTGNIITEIDNRDNISRFTYDADGNRMAEYQHSLDRIMVFNIG